MADEEMAYIECNNSKCPHCVDDYCEAPTAVEIFFHPGYHPSFACWWSDNKPEEED